MRRAHPSSPAASSTSSGQSSYIRSSAPTLSRGAPPSSRHSSSAFSWGSASASLPRWCCLSHAQRGQPTQCSDASRRRTSTATSSGEPASEPPHTVHHPQYITHSASQTVHHRQYITHSTSPTVHHRQYITHSASPTVHHRQCITHSTSLPYTALPHTALPYTALPYTALPYTALPYTALPDRPLPFMCSLHSVHRTDYCTH